MRRPVYLDNHATTRTDPQVVEAMLPYFTERLWERGQRLPPVRMGSRGGRRTRPRAGRQGDRGRDAGDHLHFGGDRIEQPRHQGTGLCRDPARASTWSRARTEHKAVLDPMKRLARQGWDVTIVDCDEYGGVSADAVAGP